MRSRPFLHVAGPRGAGKTTFIERLLDAEVALAICVRAERDAKLRREQESSPRTHAELRRYRKAGGGAVALYRFREPDTDTFFMSAIMQEYSEAVFIEGDCPFGYVDLSVFVAPPLQSGRSLLRRVVRDHAAAHQVFIGRLKQALESDEVLVRLLGETLGVTFAALATTRPHGLDDVRRSLNATLSDAREAGPDEPTEHWALEEGYAGLERAQLVVVNVRPDADRHTADALIEDIARLRKDDAIHRDVLGLGGSKVPVTAVVADLLNPKDAGLKKAVARVKRATRRSSPA